ncbi:glycine cleavage system H-protein subunit [Orbilia oligospora]|uniref:Glycine cleavage system H protein n=1 Tax=Orbilia oligospora TaxID=2813651 RepID=A0A7C8KDL5_ORBOL|nr:glycine cleavage system H-protein subunit [Orbilia oligospora]KAF3102057.1 glycine cleavage system H-protein subunit [Orbilia oligospora]KAF3109441.1 glycine cleavage system H-protein subunit [Orbilia oligospora]KAF3134117.1 glycine cleavage system H-protein subunit [Orbilia oligospora]KAF3145801.1 glycine cleavage system H-protein subunit [Orbilia oligospora]
MASTLRIVSRALPRASGTLCRATSAAPVRILGAPLSRRHLSGTAARFEIIKRYTEDHEWISYDTDTGIGTIGITNYAQEKLGEVVFIELPEIDSTVEADDSIGAVESVKSASDIMSPVTGEVIEVNDALSEKPKLINEDPEGGDGWIVKIEVAEGEVQRLQEELMDEAAYERFTKE